MDPSRAYILRLLRLCLEITEHPQGFKAVSISIANIAYDYYNYVMSKAYVESLQKCMIEIFIGGGAGVVDGEWGSSERCLKWGCGGRGSLRDLSINILKQGVGKGKSCS